MKKQTAVEWLWDELYKLNSAVSNMEITPEEYHKRKINLNIQSKQMEREQIEEAYLQGMYAKHDIRGQLKASKYYEENYGN